MKRLIFWIATGVTASVAALVLTSMLLFPSLVVELADLMPTSLPTPPKGFDVAATELIAARWRRSNTTRRSLGASGRCASIHRQVLKGAELPGPIPPARQSCRRNQLGEERGGRRHSRQSVR